MVLRLVAWVACALLGELFHLLSIGVLFIAQVFLVIAFALSTAAKMLRSSAGRLT